MRKTRPSKEDVAFYKPLLIETPTPLSIEPQDGLWVLKLLDFASGLFCPRTVQEEKLLRDKATELYRKYRTQPFPPVDAEVAAVTALHNEPYGGPVAPPKKVKPKVNDDPRVQTYGDKPCDTE